MTLQRRITLLLLVSLLALLVPLGAVTILEARQTALQTLQTSTFARLGYYRATTPGELTPLVATALELGGYGFLLDNKGSLTFTDTAERTLPSNVRTALETGKTHYQQHGSDVFAVLPLEEGVVGLALPVQAITNLTRRLVVLYSLSGAVLFLVIGLIGRWGLAALLSPLKRLSEDVRERSAQNLTMVTEPTSPELKPIARRLNELLSNVAEALSRSKHQEAAAKRFAAQASHELRTPLTALSNYLDILERHPYEHRALKGSRREAGRMRDLIEALLLLARLGGRAQAQPEAVNLSEFFTKYYPTLVFRYTHEDTILAEANLLQLVVENLVSNAGRYGRPPVGFGLEVTGQTAWLVCEDQGDGFSEEMLARGLEPFVHGEVGGTGLGLAIVRAVAEVHGGEVRLANAPHGGARVAVRFRLASG